MFKSVFLITVRKLWRNKLFAMINIVGLFLGMASFIFIKMYVQYEKSFDHFRSPDVYRIAAYHYQNNTTEISKSAQIVPAVAPNIVRDIPEVESAVRLVHTAPFMADPVIQVGDKSFREEKIYYADADFLEMFSIKMVSGSPREALASPFQAAISEQVARKYFGDTNVMGETLFFHRGERGMIELKVTGVFEDNPSNTHLHPEILISFNTFRFPLDDNWNWDNFYTYIKLTPGTDPAVVERKLPSFLNQYIQEKMAADASDGHTMKLVLQSIQDIHLDSKLWAELEANGDRRTVNFLSAIAIIILISAYINYINFAIARSTESIKEVSVRKISGSNQIQLILQMMGESAVVNCIAGLICVVSIVVALPVLRDMLSLPSGVVFGVRDIRDTVYLLIAGIIISGLYPAYAISSLQPVSNLKSKSSQPVVRGVLNRALVVFQFTGSIILIISTVTIYRQLNYMRSHDTGFSLDKTLVVKGAAIKDSMYVTHQEFFYDQIAKLKGISLMSISSSVPGQELQWERNFHRADDPENPVSIRILAIDENFLDLFKGSFAAGHNFSDATPANQDAVIFNETAVKLLGYKSSGDIVGQTVVWNESKEERQIKRVIGVVKDYNQQSLRNEIGPIVFALKKYVNAPWAGEYYTFKVSAQTPAVIDEIRQVWSDVFAGNPFDYFFLEEFYDAQYRGEQIFGRIFRLFSAIAIVIACLGLFGLSTYMTILRIKEIGIRKALGASNFSIVNLLAGDFLIWVILAFVLACPVTFFLMNKWLQQFAYRTSLSVWVFLVSGVACFFIAWLTVIWKSWGAASVNPSKALKYE
jgi:putative ABC transport system permease protein